MSRRLTRLSLGSLLLASSLMGCGLDTRPTALKDYPQHLLSATSLGGGFSLTLSPQPGEEVFCPELLPTVRATLNGHPLAVEDRGHAQNTALGSICIGASFRLTDLALSPEARAEVVSTVELSDETRTLRMEVKGLGVQRTARIVEPASGSLSVGEEVAIEWLPATDVLQASEFSVSLFSIPTQGRDSRTLTGDALRIEGNRIRFTLPEFQPGALSIRLSSGNSGPIIACNTRCELTEGVVTLETEVR
jgi:hypothetical protein